MNLPLDVLAVMIDSRLQKSDKKFYGFNWPLIALVELRARIQKINMGELSYRQFMECRDAMVLQKNRMQLSEG